MCTFVCSSLVQYSFDERQPQGQGSAGQQGSDDAGDMDDSFSKQVNTVIQETPRDDMWHEGCVCVCVCVCVWTSHYYCVTVNTQIKVGIRVMLSVTLNTSCRFEHESSLLNLERVV